MEMFLNDYFRLRIEGFQAQSRLSTLVKRNIYIKYDALLCKFSTQSVVCVCVVRNQCELASEETPFTTIDTKMVSIGQMEI